MQYSIENNLLSGARLLDSPNQDERPVGVKPDLLIIHNISLPPGEYNTGCIDQLFCNSLNPDEHPYFMDSVQLRVSSHLCVNRDGGVTQYVPLHRRAWHAGESSFQGQPNCNDYSIGIELEGTDFEDFTAAQYDSLISITNLLIDEYSCLNSDRIVGHSDVAPGRKTDPGPCFDWVRYKSAITVRCS
jgi:AmpD protein